MLPVGGATYTVLRLLYKQLLELLRKRRLKTAIIWDYLKPFGMAIVSIWGLAIFLFLAMRIWFPSIELPQRLKIIGIIILIPYFIVVGALYGLSRAVAGGAGSASGIISDVTDMISDDKNRNDKKA